MGMQTVDPPISPEVSKSEVTRIFESCRQEEGARIERRFRAFASSLGAPAALQDAPEMLRELAKIDDPHLLSGPVEITAGGKIIATTGPFWSVEAVPPYSSWSGAIRTETVPPYGYSAILAETSPSGGTFSLGVGAGEYFWSEWLKYPAENNWLLGTYAAAEGELLQRILLPSPLDSNTSVTVTADVCAGNPDTREPHYILMPGLTTNEARGIVGVLGYFRLHVSAPNALEQVSVSRQFLAAWAIEDQRAQSFDPNFSLSATVYMQPGCPSFTVTMQCEILALLGGHNQKPRGFAGAQFTKDRWEIYPFGPSETAQVRVNRLRYDFAHYTIVPIVVPH